MTFDGIENQNFYMHACSDSKSKEILKGLIFVCFKVYRETQSYNKDSKNNFGQFKVNIF